MKNWLRKKTRLEFISRKSSSLNSERNCRVQSKFCLCIPRQRGCRGPGLLPDPSATSAFPSAMGTKATAAPASQAERVCWPEKLSRPAGGRCSTWEPAPQRPPGETSEPPERNTEATDRQEGYQTGPEQSERPDVQDFFKWVYFKTQRDNRRLCRGSPGGRLSFQARVTRAPGGKKTASWWLRHTSRTSLPGLGAQTSLPRMALHGSLEPHFQIP